MVFPLFFHKFRTLNSKFKVFHGGGMFLVYTFEELSDIIAI